MIRARSSALPLFLALALSAGAPAPVDEPGVRATEAMARAATRFLDGLTAEQRSGATFGFEDAERLNWHFIPRERRGLPLKQMTGAQRTLARSLLETGLGQRGMMKADAVIQLELVLRELGGNPEMRDPELYFFSVFGTPSADQPWGWRMEGHHLSLNFTVVRGTMVATAPSFFGANPARVPSGPREGQRALRDEEDAGRALVTSLDATQRAIAIISADAPRDIITGNTGQIDPLVPVGIATDRLNAEQRTRLGQLIDVYLARMSDDLATARRAALERTDFGKVTFAWAGSIETGAPHYYRVQGPTFMIEFDNTQNNANHIHSVWRDFAGDFGRDLLREHYRDAPHPH
ncbi:MAG: DUF3500 domain-containing protein [Gemmatimonadetes bacterium]|nr:DUF3500 domain-containing protein [Gemmatimonadota bacterium]